MACEKISKMAQNELTVVMTTQGLEMLRGLTQVTKSTNAAQIGASSRNAIAIYANRSYTTVSFRIGAISEDPDDLMKGSPASCSCFSRLKDSTCTERLSCC